MDAEIRPTTDARWSTFLQRVQHDVYHLPGYVALESDEQHEPVGVFVSDGLDTLFVPLVLRPVPDLAHAPDGTYQDARSPYGYPGPISTTQNTEFLREGYRTLLNELRVQGVVSLFLRSHPLMPFPVALFKELGATVPQHGSTIGIDLTQPREELWRQTRSNHRTGINRCHRRGYTVSVESNPADFTEFIWIYEETMRRVGAAPSYFFPPHYYEQLRQVLGPNLHLVSVLDGPTTACSGLFTTCGGITQYHLSGTRTEYINHHPSKLMLDGVRWWAKERGEACFHLGGGLGGKHDSLFDFKAGYSDLRLPFHTARFITNHEVFEALTTSWEQQSGLSETSNDFFPPYRRRKVPILA